MKSTDFNDRKEYDLARCIYEAGGHKGYRTYELFSAFCFFAFAALRQGVWKVQTGAINAELEAEYLEQEARFPNPKKFSEAMALLVQELEAKPRDVLGNVYQCLGMADKDFAGQCFTPASLSEMLARMTLGEEITPDPNYRLTINEPACGGGAMAIAATNYLKQRGFEPRHYFLWAQDISTICFQMSYVQLSLLGVPAVVIRGDTLRGPQESDTHALTFLGALFPFRESQRQRRVEITARTRERAPQLTARIRTR